MGFDAKTLERIGLALDAVVPADSSYVLVLRQPGEAIVMSYLDGAQIRLVLLSALMSNPGGRPPDGQIDLDEVRS